MKYFFIALFSCFTFTTFACNITCDQFGICTNEIGQYVVNLNNVQFGKCTRSPNSYNCKVKSFKNFQNCPGITRANISCKDGTVAICEQDCSNCEEYCYCEPVWGGNYCISLISASI